MFVAERADKVWEKIKENCPAVCLYVVPTASDDTKGGAEASRTEILDWCLTNQFELVQCDDGDDDEEEDDFDEREGKVRIVSALKAHTWSNLQLEEESPSGRGNILSSDVTVPSLENLDLGDLEVSREIQQLVLDQIFT